MEESIKIGSSILNDINGFESDEKIELVENNNVSACIMHKKGTPLKMQDNPHYTNLMQDLTVFFEKKKLILKKLINENRLLLDPGIGFGKTFEHNKAIIKNLNSFFSVEVPILIGISRKSFLHEFANEDLKDRDVLILEDIVDSGNTLAYVMENLSTYQPNSLKVATFLFKPNAYKKDFPVDYRGIEVGNEFLVGYGLDFDGLGRNFEDIYIIED